MWLGKSAWDFHPALVSKFRVFGVYGDSGLLGVGTCEQVSRVLLVTTARQMFLQGAIVRCIVFFSAGYSAVGCGMATAFSALLFLQLILVVFVDFDSLNFQRTKYSTVKPKTLNPNGV
jgi:hypothetical protein